MKKKWKISIDPFLCLLLSDSSGFLVKNQITYEHMKIVNEYLCTQFIECQNDLRVADCKKYTIFPQDKDVEEKYPSTLINVVGRINYIWWLKFPLQFYFIIYVVVDFLAGLCEDNFGIFTE